MDTSGIIRNIRIGEVLKQSGYIDDAAIDNALEYQKSHEGVRLGEALIELGSITEEQMLTALSQRLGLPMVDLAEVEVDIDAVKLIPEDVARRTCTLAIASDEYSLTLITNDPVAYFNLEEIRQITGKNLIIELCSKAPLERAIGYYYHEVSAFMQAEDASADFDLDEINTDIDVEEGDAPIIKLLNSLVEHAYVSGASDIHIEPFSDQTSVRVRIDGSVVDYLTIKRSVHNPLIARIKIISSLDIAERYMPQDGHFRTSVNGDQVNVRVSVIPTVFGEKAVLRLLASNNPIDHSGTFGMRDDDYAKFSRMIQSPNGIVYLTGPTGSGKTTTLYMVLEHVSSRQVNISTIEDPVERNLPRVNQVQVNETSGLTFGVGLRSLMRQDPDIIMLGETRDTETATIAVRAAITGHLVFSTLHTNDAASTIHRLSDMGVEPYMISSSLSGIVAQRLMRKVCPNCAVERPATESELEALGKAPTDEVTIREGSGCPHCNRTGYKGRLAIHEILEIDRDVRHMIIDGASDEEIRDHAVKNQQMKTLQMAAVEAVLRGDTTPEEMYKIAFHS